MKILQKGIGHTIQLKCFYYYILSMKSIQLEHIKIEISRAKTTELQLKTCSYTSLCVYVWPRICLKSWSLFVKFCVFSAIKYRYNIHSIIYRKKLCTWLSIFKFNKTLKLKRNLIILLLWMLKRNSSNYEIKDYIVCIISQHENFS